MDIVRKKPQNNIHERIFQTSCPKVNPSESAFPSSKQELRITQENAADFAKAEKKYQRGLKIKLFCWYLLGFLLLVLFSTGVFFAWKTYTTSKKINSQQTQVSSFSQDLHSLVSVVANKENIDSLQGAETGRVNILLLGAAGEKKPGTNLTDTVMVMSIDTKNKKMALLSLPRDLYVKIPNTTKWTKLNSLYQIGLSQNEGAQFVQQTVQQITNLSIPYYVVVNFDGFEKIINDIGGINVTVERDIYDARYPGPNYSYQTFELKKGFHTLDGATALKYVRERHDDPEGDFGRAKRQQQVMQAVKNKIFSAQTLLNVLTLSQMLDTLGDNIKTNISFDELAGFLALSKQIDTQNINNSVVDAWKKDSLLKVSHVQVGAVRAFILVPRIGSYNEIQTLAENIFDRETLQKRQTLLEAEKASILLINETSDREIAEKLRRLFNEKLGFQNVHVKQMQTAIVREQTLVLDNTESKKLYSLDELVKKIPASLATEQNTFDQTDLPEVDFVVLIGNDAVKAYNYDEDSIEEYNNAQDNQENLIFPEQ